MRSGISNCLWVCPHGSPSSSGEWGEADSEDGILSMCLVCDSAIEPFMSFGRLPIASSSLSREQSDGEFLYRLRVVFCPSCMLDQGEILGTCVEERDPFIVEMGSNDGIMLRHLTAAGIPVFPNARRVEIFHDACLGNIVEKTEYDLIYAEHSYYFLVKSTCRLFREHGPKVTEVMPQRIRGKSTRCTIIHRQPRQVPNLVCDRRAGGQGSACTDQTLPDDLGFLSSSRCQRLPRGK